MKIPGLFVTIRLLDSVIQSTTTSAHHRTARVGKILRVLYGNIVSAVQRLYPIFNATISREARSDPGVAEARACHG